MCNCILIPTGEMQEQCVCGAITGRIINKKSIGTLKGINEMGSGII